MALSKLTITFNELNKIGGFIRFSVKDGAGNTMGPMHMIFQLEHSSNPAVIQMGQPFGSGDQNTIWNKGTLAAQMYKSALTTAYGHTNLFTSEVQGNDVVITSSYPGNTFVSISMDNVGSFVVENEESVEIETYQLNVTNTSFSANGIQPCGRYNISIDTDLPFDKVSVNGAAPNTISPAATNWVAPFFRDIDYYVVFIKTIANGQQVETRYPSTGKIKIPKLEASNFTLYTDFVLGVGSLRVQQEIASLLSYDYSIDGGSTWQSTSLFDNLSSGDYTLTIRDRIASVQMNCTIEIDFSIEAAVTREAYSYISRANAISFIRKQETDDIDSFVNQTNSFSNTDKLSINYCSEALLQTNDSTKIQIKSSYEDVEVLLIKENGDTWQVPVNQRTDNIGKFKSMDCIMSSYMTGKSVIYFTFGRVYDRLGVQIDSYSLNGALPDFAVIGQKVSIAGYGLMEIDDIIYLDSIGIRAIVVNQEFNETVPTSYIMKSEYDVLNYNIYDFSIIWAAHGEGTYEILITLNGLGLTPVEYLSENINIKDKHRDTVAVSYFNTNNRDIFYKYDIKHFIRVPVLSINTLIIDEIENNLTDTSVDLVKSTVNEGNIFNFEEMVREHIVKMAIALSCEYVFIDGEGYTKNDNFDFEQIEGTNLQLMSAQMLKNGSNYNNTNDYYTGIDLGEEELEIPVIFTTPPNFIKL